VKGHAKSSLRVSSNVQLAIPFYKAFLPLFWCNPAPLVGSAPNLVTLNYDKHGKPYYKRAFNT
jgi:hypothetical protein